MMKLPFSPNHFAAARWLLAALTALVVVLPAPVRAAQEERWLLVFDTSAVMKKRLPAVEAAVKNFFAVRGGGQLRPSNTVGVWTFGQQPRMGEFPLVMWPPDDVELMASNLLKFVHSRKYAGVSSLAALQPALGRVVAASERLTVVVFCDGASDINWTPYDDGINQTFKLGQAERKNARQPFVLVLRSQRGKFTGGTVTFPPGTLNIPPFPPLPPLEPIKTVPTNPPPDVVTPPPAVVPSLIIVGTKVSTNEDDLPKADDSRPVKISKPATNPAPVAPPPVPVKPATTNSAAAPVKTDQATHVVPPPNALRLTNPPAAAVEMPANPPPVALTTNAPPAATTNLAGTADTGEPISWGLVLAGAGAFVVAVALVVVLAVRRRAPRGSLISSSMNPPPPPWK